MRVNLHGTVALLIMLMIMAHAPKAAADPVYRPRYDAYRYAQHAELGDRTSLYLFGSEATASTLADELRRSPGLRVLDLGGTFATSFATIQGSSTEQVQVLLNGIPLHDAYEGAFDLSLLPLPSLARANVYRTPMTLNQAAPRPGGTIDLWTGFQPTQDWSVGGSFGSYASRRFHLVAEDDSYTENYHLSFVYTGNSGAYEAFSNGGTPFDAEDDGLFDRDNNGLANFSTMLGYRNDLYQWQLDGFTWFVHDRRDVRGPAQASLDQVELRQWRLMVGGRAYTRDWIDDLTLELVGGLSFGRHTVLDPDDELFGTGARGRDDLFHSYLSIRPTWLVLDAVAVRTLIEAQLEGMDPQLDADQSPVNSAQRFTFASAIDTSASLVEDVLQLEGGVRMDHRVDRDMRGTNVEDTFSDTAFSPRVALALERDLGDYNESAFHVDLTWFQAHRPPTFVERFGGRNGRVGDPELEAESSENFDATIAVTIDDDDDVVATVAYGYFMRRTEDEIVPVRLQTGQRSYANLRSTFGFGHEVRTAFELFRRFGAGVGVGYQPVYDRTGELDDNTLLIPGRSALLIDVDFWTRIAGFTFEHRTSVSAQTFADRDNTAPIPAIPNTSFAMRYSPAYSWDSWSLGIEVQNVFNLRSLDTARDFGETGTTVESPIEEIVGYPQEGRTFFVTFVWAPGTY